MLGGSGLGVPLLAFGRLRMSWWVWFGISDSGFRVWGRLGFRATFMCVCALQPMSSNSIPFHSRI